MELSERHHYLPEYYLKGFTDLKNANRLWVYDKSRKTSFCAGLKKTGVIRNYYMKINDNGTKDDSFESYLSNKVENPANLILDKIRSHNIISIAEKSVLSTYISFMLKRVPQHRKRMEYLLPGAAKFEKHKTIEAINHAIKRNPEKISILEQYKDLITEMLDVDKITLEKFNIPKGNFNTFINDSLAPLFLDMHWGFFITEGPSYFLTCDNPVYYDEVSGLAKSDFCFPISKIIMLWGTWKRDFGNSYYKLKQSVVKKFNRIIVNSATRFIYYYKKEDWVFKLINKSHFKGEHYF